MAAGKTPTYAEIEQMKYLVEGVDGKIPASELIPAGGPVRRPLRPAHRRVAGYGHDRPAPPARRVGPTQEACQ